MEEDGERFVWNREKRKHEWKRKSASRFELSRMKKEGRFEKQTDFCRRRETEMEDCWSNDSMYLLPLHCGKGKETEKGGRWEEAKRGRRCRCASTTGA